jgi:predicted MFS family arabinose efflux permease
MGDDAAPGAWRVALAGLIALAAAVGIGRFVFTPLLPMMQHDAGLTITAGGWLAAANYLGYFAGALSGMWLRVPAGTMVRWGLVLNAVLIAAMGFGEHVGWWLAVRALAGVVSAWVLVFGSAVVLKQLAQNGRVELSSVMFAGIGIGMVLSGAICIGFVAANLSSRIAWLVFGVVTLLATAVAWPAFRDRSSATAVASAAPTRPRWTRAMLRLTVAYGLFGFGYIIPATFLPVIARDALNDPRYYVWFWPLCGFAAAVSALLSAWLARHVRDRDLLSACYLAEAIGVGLPAFVARPWSIGAAAVLRGGTFVVITVTALREARALAPAHSSHLIAAMTAAFALGQIAGPVAAAYSVGPDGSFTSPLLLAAATLLAALALLPRDSAVDA